jgi:polyphosphate glucokinase
MRMTPKPAKTAAPPPASRDAIHPNGPVTLSIDIGGSGLKAMLLDAAGKPLCERQRIPTPTDPAPEAVLKALDELRRRFPEFDRVSVGFPGIVKHSSTYGAVNLHPEWAGGYPLQAEMEKRWKKPVRVGNDADVAGYGAIKGEGVELVITLGTGMGGALFTNGHLVPGLELGHHPWRKGKTYEELLGRRGLDEIGKKAWNKLLKEALAQIEFLFNYEHLYLGGGNTKKINFELPANVTIVSNESGLLGGVVLWRDQG